MAAVDFMFVTGEIVKMTDRPRPLILMIDGCRHSPAKESNAIAEQAEKYARAAYSLSSGKMRLIVDYGNIHPMHDEEIGHSHIVHTVNQVSDEFICGDNPRAMGAGRNLSSLAPNTMADISRIPRLVEKRSGSLLAAY